jgi:hypothetical protein
MKSYFHVHLDADTFITVNQQLQFRATSSSPNDAQFACNTTISSPMPSAQDNVLDRYWLSEYVLQGDGDLVRLFGSSLLVTPSIMFLQADCPRNCGLNQSSHEQIDGLAIILCPKMLQFSSTLSSNEYR